MKRLQLVMVVMLAAAFSACFAKHTTSGTESTSSTRVEAPASGGSTEAPAATGTGETAEQPAATPLRTLYVNVTAANVRATPSRDGEIVTKLKFLDPVGATGTLQDEWVEIEITMPDGALRKAWIHSTLVSASKEQAEAVKAASGK